MLHKRKRKKMSATSEFILREITELTTEMNEAAAKGEDVAKYHRRLEKLNERLARANAVLNEGTVLKG